MCQKDLYFAAWIIVEVLLKYKHFHVGFAIPSRPPRLRLSFLVYIQIAPLQRDAPELLSRINWGHIKAPSPSSHAEAVFTKYESNLMDWLLVEGKSSEHFIYLEVSQFFRLFSS